ncbi:hypothetical protein [Hoeflea sp. TYP-13]|uniref:hypothetical protein n=1 Tax=Hoeflea sp. TYP-13 TaxID=3230023 RepID=UPI0034C6AC67
MKKLYDRALAAPERVFSTPEELVHSTKLTVDQKIEVLRRWEYQASEDAVALEEGMPGEETGLLRRILIALGELAGPLNLDCTGPSKQHGVPHAAIRKQSGNRNG